ncbi:MAG: hypothetical protein ACFFCW_39555, partial [Candidatus Hodarchaeota archaeon]
MEALKNGCLLVDKDNQTAYALAKEGSCFTAYQLSTYQKQPDWLKSYEMDGLDRFPNSERTDLVYLLVWQQEVSAVEDTELAEVALNGVDTTARLKTFGRVQIQPGIKASDCVSAWEEVKTLWKDKGIGDVAETGEIKTDIKLKVDFSNQEESTNLCSPTISGGYVGADNQTLLVSTLFDRYLTWAFNNASSLHRIRITSDRKTVEFETLPKDAFHYPKVGQFVEILAWSSELSNGEKTAEIMGPLTSVARDFNPEDFTLMLADGYPSEYPIEDNEGHPIVLYLRVWEGLLPLKLGEAIPLGNTGVSVTITGKLNSSYLLDMFVLRKREFWTIAVRPKTPQEIYPKRLRIEQSPDGIRRFVCPLALIKWTKTDPLGE